MKLNEFLLEGKGDSRRIFCIWQDGTWTWGVFGKEFVLGRIE